MCLVVGRGGTGGCCNGCLSWWVWCFGLGEG